MFKNEYAVDIEVLPNYFSIGVYHMNTSEWKYYEQWNDRGQNALVNFIRWAGKLTSEDAVYTYFGRDYDLPVLKSGADRGGKLTNDEWFELSQDVIGREGDDRFRGRVKQWLNFTHIDLYELLNMNVSLKKAAATLAFPHLQDMPKEWNETVNKGGKVRVAGKYMTEAKAMQEYCKIDCMATAHIARYADTEIKDRMVLDELYPGLDIISDGRPRVAKKILVHLYKEKTGENAYSLKKRLWGDDKNAMYRKLAGTTIDFSTFIPRDFYHFRTPELYNLLRELQSFSRMGWYGTEKDTKKYKFHKTVTLFGKEYTVAEGGLHDDFGPGVYRSNEDIQVFNIDASSFYPMIAIVMGIDPAHLPGYQIIAKELVDFRLHHKSNRKSSDRSKDISNSTKIVINTGLFGLLGDYYSPMYDPKGTLSVTMNGQLMLLQLIEFLCHDVGGIEVIQANTDGIGVLCPRKLIPRLKAACAFWEESFGIELEIDALDVFTKRNANSYLEVEHGEIVKGAKDFNDFIKRGGTKDDLDPTKSRSFQIINECLRQYYAFGKRPEEVIKECDSIHEFLRVVSCGRTAQNYFQIDGADWGKMQRTARYYKAVRGGNLGVLRANGKNINQHPHGDSVRVLLDVEDRSPASYPDLDIKWYVNKAWEEIREVDKLAS